MAISSKLIVKVLLIMIFISVMDGSLHERAEELQRTERGAETENIAIDVQYKLPPTAPGYSSLLDVALVSLGFVFGVTAITMYRLAIPQKCNPISEV